MAQWFQNGPDIFDVSSDSIRGKEVENTAAAAAVGCRLGSHDKEHNISIIE
jgi:hypothetical protein